jgi:hypothetical protein
MRSINEVWADASDWQYQLEEFLAPQPGRNLPVRHLLLRRPERQKML